VASHGIKDRVAIIGMGCTPFAEHFDMGVDELLLGATGEAFADAGVTKDDVDAYWLGTAQSNTLRSPATDGIAQIWSTLISRRNCARAFRAPL